MAIKVKSAVRSPVAIQAPAAPTDGSISPPSAVKTLVVGISDGSAGSGSTTRVPTRGWLAMGGGVASGGEVRLTVPSPSAAAAAPAPPRAERRFRRDDERSELRDMEGLLVCARVPCGR